MGDAVTIPCAVTVALPRKLVNELAAAVRQRQTGNFVVHIRSGVVMGFTFERKHSLSNHEQCDEIVLG